MILIYYGLSGIVALKKKYIAIHGVITCGVLGCFLVFSIMEILFKRFDANNDINEKYILLLFCIPYLIDLFAGLCTFYLVYLLY